MLIRILGLLLGLCIGTQVAVSQGACSALGQNPSTAFPVCGVDTFAQNTVPLCGTHPLEVPGCGGAGYSDRNPFWYKFTCYTSGTLGFLITPNDLGDDYDWQLYDITGHNPNDVYTDPSLVVAGNWAGTYGLTGAAPGGINGIGCASDPATNDPTFARMPLLQAGHQYILLISHFTDSQSGYKLSFGGGSAVITDPKIPALQTALPDCGAFHIAVRINKHIKCSSLAINGSDFSISPANATVIGANAPGCGSAFDVDSVILTLSNSLPPGNYNVVVNSGNDGNTLLDNCNNAIPVGNVIPFTVFPIQPTPLDSITPVACSPDKLQLVFRRPIQCASIAAGGGDFVLSGPSGVTITGAAGSTCSADVASTIELTLSAPIKMAGTYQVQLVTGPDGNTIVDECGQETPAGATISFTGYDTVAAAFTYQVFYGCKQDTIAFGHDGANGVNQWHWTFDNTFTSAIQNPIKTYTVFGDKVVKLKVSNGVCEDSTSISVLLDNGMAAAFAYPDILCPEDVPQLVDNSTGHLVSWYWDFGNGTTSNLQVPPTPQFNGPVNAREVNYTVKLVVENDHGCFDSVSHKIKKVNTCRIAVPNAFTPNNDGHNDYLYPLNAWKAGNLVFKIYNRYGQVVFETRDWNRRWDGTINGHQQEAGTYVWVLQYIDHDSGQPVFLKGTTVLIR